MLTYDASHLHQFYATCQMYLGSKYLFHATLSFRSSPIHWLLPWIKVKFLPTAEIYLKLPTNGINGNDISTSSTERVVKNGSLLPLPLNFKSLTFNLKTSWKATLEHLHRVERILFSFREMVIGGLKFLNNILAYSSDSDKYNLWKRNFLQINLSVFRLVKSLWCFVLWDEQNEWGLKASSEAQRRGRGMQCTSP